MDRSTVEISYEWNQHVPFCVWYRSFSIRFLRFIYLRCQGLLMCVVVQYSIVRREYILFIPSSIDGWSYDFEVGAVIISILQRRKQGIWKSSCLPEAPNSRSEGAQVWPGNWTTELAKGQERNQAKGSGRGSNAGNRTWWVFCSRKALQVTLKGVVSSIPGRLSGQESACQCRSHRFYPQSGRVPHAWDQLSLRARTIEPAL